MGRPPATYMDGLGWGLRKEPLGGLLKASAAWISAAATPLATANPTGLAVAAMARISIVGFDSTFFNNSY